MLKHKIIQALGKTSAMDFYKILKASGRSAAYHIGYNEFDVETAKAELKPEFREKFEKMNYTSFVTAK